MHHIAGSMPLSNVKASRSFDLSTRCYCFSEHGSRSPHINERAAIVNVANAEQQQQRALGEKLTAKFSGEICGEVCWRSLLAKCAARHPAKDAAKFRRYL